MTFLCASIKEFNDQPGGDGVLRSLLAIQVYARQGPENPIDALLAVINLATLVVDWITISKPLRVTLSQNTRKKF